MSSHVERLTQAHRYFNSRDFDSFASMFSPSCVYTDHARGIQLRGGAQFKAYLTEWTKAFSDCAVVNATHIDGGNYVIAQFTAQGTNDGIIGQSPATGRKMSLSFCEVVRFNDEGEIVSGDLYYDQLSMLWQLGLAQPQTPPTPTEKEPLHH